MFTRLCEKAGLQEKRTQRGENTLSVHNLRHTFATQLAMQGANAYQIKAILGHASVATSQAYIRLLERVGE
jgi:site-specific recombinase XerD